MKSHKIVARTFGIFFLLGFLSYGIGSGLANASTEASDSLSNLNQTSLVVGVILLAVVHTAANIGLPVLMLPILKPFNRFLTYGYLSAVISATVILIVGSIFLILFIPLSASYLITDVNDLTHFDTIASLLRKGHFYSYQIAMAIWALGGLIFCYLLLISNLLPRFLTIWGSIAYLVFMAGTLCELFGFAIGVPLAIPGGLFEITLSIWLIIKGFNDAKLSRR